MFNDKLGLTQAVLDGRKTQTRRITCDDLVTLNTGYKVIPEEIFCKESVWYYKFKNGHIDKMIKSHLPKYKVGEVVAVAQSYVDCGNLPDYELDEDGYPIMPTRSGFFNKMFVRAELMPNQIRITNVRVECLQDISDDDCLKEGVRKVVNENGIDVQYYVGHDACFETPREAFANLIDKVSGKGTWDSNPWVWVYDFELFK